MRAPWLALLVACGPGGDPSGSDPLPSLTTTTTTDHPYAPGYETPGARPAPSVAHTTPDDPDAPGVPAFPNVDVLVIGAGPAGLAAALEASRAGASVAVLEREADFGGSANWAGALMLFSGTPEQAAAGVTDSPEQLLAEWASFTGGDPEDPWVRAFAERNVADVYEWLTALGVTWIGPGRDSSSGPTARVLSVVGGGPAMVAAMEAPLDGGTILYEAEATELVQDRAGRVIGARWRDLALDEAHFARADTVIVATGGFLRDLERVRDERPDLADRDLRWGSWPGADGNGLAMAEAVGAATENLDAIGIYAHGVPAAEPFEELRTATLGGAAWINTLGRRFADESDTNGFATGELRAAQPDGEAWALYDGASAATAVFTASDEDATSFGLPDLVAAGIAAEAEDLDALADTLGVDPAAVEEEVVGFNAFVYGVSASDTFRATRGAMRAIAEPPFYAVPIAITVAKGFGGVDVDLSGRVVGVDGAVIPGLYAAGELAGMAGGTLVGEYGFTGSLTAVVLGGRIAGGAAAAEAMGE